MHKIVPCSWMIIKQWCKMGYKDTFIVMYTNLLWTLLLIAWQSSYMNLCYSGMLEQLSLLLSEHCHLLVAATAFLCKLVSWVSLNIIHSPWSNTEVGTTQSAKRQIISQRTWLTSGVIFSTRPGIYNCISFSLMSKKEN